MKKIVAATLSLSLAQFASVHAAPGAFIIENANVIAMTSDAAPQKMTVLVKNGKIAKLCAKEKECRNEGAVTISGKGKYLIPGLTDMHGHIDLLVDSPLPVPAKYRKLGQRAMDEQLRQYILFGVTTVRDPAGGPTNLALREAIDAGERVGPRLFTTYIPMGGDPPIFIGPAPFSKPEAAAERVRETKALGYDEVKIYSGLSPEVFDAIMATANEVGLRVGGHLPIQVDLEHALQMGVRSVEHLTGFDVACASMFGEKIYVSMSDIYQGLSFCTESDFKQIAEMTAKYDTWVDPTLVLFATAMNINLDRSTVADPVQLENTPPILGTFFEEHLKDIFPARARVSLKGATSIRGTLVRILSEAGVPLLTGADTMAAGYNIHQELALLVEAGLTPYQALTASTSEPARYFEKEGEFGTIVEGASADLVLLDKNPLKDITNTMKIRGVMVRGEWWDKDRIDAAFGELYADYNDDAETLAKFEQTDGNSH